MICEVTANLNLTEPILIVDEDRVFDRVRESQFFGEYCSAFKTATGLNLELTRSDEVRFALCSREHGSNQFCQLMSEKGIDCETCRLLNLELVEQINQSLGGSGIGKEGECSVRSTLKSPKTMQMILASDWSGPRTFECFAGMCETMVPVKSEQGLIGFLKTGQVLLKEPTHEAFERALDRIDSVRLRMKPEEIKRAYFATPVVPPCQYEAMVTLLKSFAEQISRQVTTIDFEQGHEDPKIVSNAKRYLSQNFDSAVTLESLAKAISVSPAHLSRVFKQSTGIGYLEYLNRHRIEVSKSLLKQKDLRISEIAFQVGFQSLAPFNRTFKKYTGMTPKDYRRF